MEHEKSAHFGLSLLSPLVGLWHFETFSSYPHRINPFHRPTKFQKVLQKDNNNPQSPTKVCPNNPLEVQVPALFFKAPTEMGTPSHTPTQYSIPKMHHPSFLSQMPQSNRS
jgi:hypothetical protein